MSLLLIGALVIGLAVLVVLQLRKQPRSKQTARKPAPGSRATPPGSSEPRRAKTSAETIDKFRGATLFPQKGACEAIMKLRGRTFPENRVPKIPVPGCDRERCECQVHEVVGRRRGPRRVAVDRRNDVRFAEDRRTGHDRREGGDTWTQRKD